jgi:hypothetical protein
VFIVQFWIRWYTGTLKRSKKGDAIWYATTYLTTQALIHIFAQFSANMGVSEDMLFLLTMKNEFQFRSIGQTPRAKHYWSKIAAQEGNVYRKYRRENKGVALRDSKKNPEILKRSQDLSFHILDCLDEDIKISVHDVLGKIWLEEQAIVQSVRRGETKFLVGGQMKDTYTNLETSAYRHHLLWESVLAAKYGQAPVPPYADVKIPIEVDNKTELNLWLDKVEAFDIRVSEGIKTFMGEKGMSKITNLRVPRLCVSGGVPEEIMLGVNIRKIVREVLASYYLVMETTGLAKIYGDPKMIISDYYEAPPQWLADNSEWIAANMPHFDLSAVG